MLQVVEKDIPLKPVFWTIHVRFQEKAFGSPKKDFDLILRTNFSKICPKFSKTAPSKLISGTRAGNLVFNPELLGGQMIRLIKIKIIKQ